MRHPSTHVAEVEHTYSGENPFRTLLYLFNDQKIRVAIAFTFFCIKHSPSWVIPLLTANIIDIISPTQEFNQLIY
jgi:ATP-binding cassette subfamily B protein